VLKFSNSKAGGLGDQLPAGIVRVYIKDSRGAPQFIGENAISHTPMGSDVAIRTGSAFDVKVKAVMTKREKITSEEWERSYRYRIVDSATDNVRTVEVQTSPTYWRTTMVYTLTNARPNPVTVDLVQAGLNQGYWSDTRAVSETVTGQQVSREDRRYIVTVPANGKTEVTAVFETRY
jgi:hypothetical protein